MKKSEHAHAPNCRNPKKRDEQQSAHALRSRAFAPALEHSNHSNEEE